MTRHLLRGTLFIACVLVPWASCPADTSPEIVITQRQFNPAVLTLPLRQRVTIVIRNEDEELHAFVPLLLLQGSHAQVTGNGAPEFNETGLARVLIPPHGRTDITFTPRTSGTFFYLCDLPGHNMRGEIIVTGPSGP